MTISEDELVRVLALYFATKLPDAAWGQHHVIETASKFEEYIRDKR